MSILVWLTMGIALWHFSIFVPDRFWQGIIGAFIGSFLTGLLFPNAVATGGIDWIRWIISIIVAMLLIIGFIQVTRKK